MNPSIQTYQKEDCSAILEIINEQILTGTALYDYQPRTLAQQLAIFDDKLQKGFPIIVAKINTEIVGFGYYSEFRFREAYKFTVEHSVYAKKNYIGKGIGHLLLSELIDLAQYQPSNLDELQQIKGFGKQKADKFGEDILAILNAV